MILVNIVVILNKPSAANVFTLKVPPLSTRTPPVRSSSPAFFMVGNDVEDNDIDKKVEKRMVMVYIKFDLSCIPIEDAMNSE